MKKLSVVILCLVLALSFCACGAKSGDMDFAPQENAMVMNDSITLYSATADSAAGTDLKVTETPEAQQNEKIICYNFLNRIFEVNFLMQFSFKQSPFRKRMSLLKNKGSVKLK